MGDAAPMFEQEEGQEEDGAMPAEEADARGDASHDAGAQLEPALGDMSDLREPASQEADAEDDEPPPPLPKRALAAWGSYILEMHGGRPSQEAGNGWKALSDEDKEPFVEKAAADKARYQQEKEAYAAWASAHPVAAALLQPAKASSVEGALDLTTAYLPLSKVRKIMKVDGVDVEVGGITKEAVFAVCKATECMLTMLGELSATAARVSKRKSITTGDLASVMYGTRAADLMAFAHADMPRSSLIVVPTTKQGARLYI